MALEDGQRSDQTSDEKREADFRIKVITRIWQMIIPVQLAAREKAALEDARAQSASPSSQAQPAQNESA
jgi:hypothetical protein